MQPSCGVLKTKKLRKALYSEGQQIAKTNNEAIQSYSSGMPSRIFNTMQSSVSRSICKGQSEMMSMGIFKEAISDNTSRVHELQLLLNCVYYQYQLSQEIPSNGVHTGIG